MKHDSHVTRVSVIQVIEVMSRVGAGKDDDPIREIVELYSMEGRLLLRQDPSPAKLPAVRTFGGLVMDAQAASAAQPRA